MKIRLATIQDEVQWNDYVANHPNGLAYHQFAWKKAVKDAYGFNDCYLLAEQEDKIIGVLPLIDFKVPLIGRSLVSLPYCDIGGCLADNDEILTALQQHAIELGQDKKVGKVKLRQSAVDGDSSAGKVRMVLELPDTSEKLLAGFKSKLRSQVKKPIRDGLTAQLGGIELVPEFYQVFCENMRDLGSPVHSRKWIDAIITHYGSNARVCIVYAVDGTPAAAGIILLTATTVSIPWASSLLKFNRSNPNMLLYWSFLSYASDNGFKQFDFGRSTLGEGTYKFKQQWGAEPVPFDWVDLLSPGTQEVGKKNNIRGKVEKIWQKLPIEVATAIGSKLRGYIDL